MFRKHVVIALILTLAPMAAAAGDESEPGLPEVSLEGLHLIEKNRRSSLYADAGVDWSVYDAIQLDTATVAFRRNWVRDQNRMQFNKIRPEDVERIKTTLAEVFDKAFTEELTRDGDYTITDNAADNVMRISPHIVDLDIYAPDSRNSPGIQRSYSESAGRMTLKLYIYDSVTGDLISAASDRRESPRRGYMEWRTSVTNTKDARLMAQRWAKDLRELLDEARAGKLKPDED
jgi:hypothetical protein